MKRKKEKKTGRVRYTDQQKEAALQMILDGKTYREVHEKFGISSTYLHSLARKRNILSRWKDGVLFPEIKKYMDENDLTIRAMSKKVGVSPKAFEHRMYGVSPFKYEEIRTLLAITGMDFDVLFREF